MDKNNVKEIIDYIINDKAVDKKISEFNDANTYYSSISHTLNFWTIPIFFSFSVLFFSYSMNFHGLATTLLTLITFVFSACISGYISDIHNPRLPYVYYFLPTLKNKYIKKQKSKLRIFYKNNLMFYKTMNHIKKSTTIHSLYKFFKKNNLDSRKQMLVLLLESIKKTKNEEEYISILSSIVVELNINKNKNEAANLLLEELNDVINSFEEDSNFKKAIISYSDSEPDEKDTAISSINNNLKKIQMIKKL
jgi:hypothetical protein